MIWCLLISPESLLLFMFYGTSVALHLLALYQEYLFESTYDYFQAELELHFYCLYCINHLCPSGHISADWGRSIGLSHFARPFVGRAKPLIFRSQTENGTTYIRS